MVSTSATLLYRVRQPQDQRAWERFIKLYAPLLHFTVRRSGVSETHAEDVVQDVFAQLLRELPRFEYDPGRGKFRSWLATVTANKCREFHRKRARSRTENLSEEALQEASVESNIEELFRAEFESAVVRRAMEIMREEFEPKSWQACWERMHGRPAAEVGRDLGMSEAAVFTATSRVLRRLRSELAGMLD